MRAILTLVLTLWSWAVIAQPAPSQSVGGWVVSQCEQANYQTGFVKTVQIEIGGGLCVYGTVTTIPAATTPAVKGFGNLVGSSASVQLSTLTLGPNSAAWPASPGMVNVITTGGVGYVCPLGGSCSASVGIPIGNSVAAWGFYQPSTNMTVYAPSGVTFTAQW